MLRRRTLRLALSNGSLRLLMGKEAVGETGWKPGPMAKETILPSLQVLKGSSVPHQLQVSPPRES